MKAVAVVVAGVLAGATPVRADGSGSGEDPLPEIVVKLGTTVETDVGTLRGVHCDDLSIITVDIATRQNRNYFSVTGKAVGSTLCRVGTDATRPGTLYRVRVVQGGIK
ncbi:MAG TPA: hypothetical protein VG916_06605 [Gemmatimonadaceae bacterium]|nr:hypothetical protein [Gemmatimonadaceae bacterium]